MKIYLDRNHHPHTKLPVFFNTWITIDCLIDTGFSGGISLPNKYEKYVKSKPVAFQRYTLADGSSREYAIYEQKVRFDSHEKVITSFFTPANEALVGIEFLIGFKFILDLKHFSISLE